MPVHPLEAGRNAVCIRETATLHLNNIELVIDFICSVAPLQNSCVLPIQTDTALWVNIVSTELVIQISPYRNRA